MAREATDGLYIELDYYTPENYHTYTAEASMIAGEYIDSGYIDIDYFQPGEGTGLFALTCDLTEVVGELKEFAGALSVVASTAPSAVKTVVVDTSLTVTATESSTVGVIKQGTVALTGAFSPSISAVAILRPDVFLESSVSFAATAVKTASNEVILSYLASLDAQAARTRAYDSALSASFGNSTTTARFRDTDSSLAVAFTATTDNTRTRDASANLSSAFSTSTSALKLQPGEIPLSVTASLSIDGKALCERPLRPVVNTVPYNTFGSLGPAFGSYAGVTYHTNGNGILEYILCQDAMPDNTTEWFAEGWVGKTTNQQETTHFSLMYDEDKTSNNKEIFFFGEVNGNRTSIVVRNDTDGSNEIDTFDGAVDNTWKHFVFGWKPGEGARLWLDGSVHHTEDDITSVTVRNNKFGRLLFGRKYVGDTYNDNISWMDEFRIVKGVGVLDKYGYDWDSTSITEPTSAFTDTVDTKLLLHWENNDTDDFIPGLAQASISATATVAVDVLRIQPGASSISSQFSLTADAQSIKEVTVAIDSAATVDATIGSIKTFEAALTNAFTPSIDAVAFINAFAILDTNTTLSADVDRLPGLIDQLSSAFSVSADVDRFLGSGASNFVTRFTSTVVGTPLYHPVRSLVHFDTLAGGVPIDERTDNTWSGAVGQFTIPNLPNLGYYTAFDKMAKFDNGILYDYDDTNAPDEPDFDGPELDLYDRVDIGTNDFVIDFKVKIGGVQGDVSADKIPLVSLQFFDAGNSDSSITVWQRPLTISAKKNSTSVTITADGLEPSGYDGLPTLTASIPIADIGEAFHITFNRQVVNNASVYRLFVNGILEETDTSTDVAPIGAGNSYPTGHSNPDLYWKLGGYWADRITAGNSTFFGGYIDEFRIVIGSALYFDDFTVPVVEYSLIFDTLEADFSSEFAVNIRPNFINEVPAALSAQFTQSTQPVVTRRITKELNSAFVSLIAPVFTASAEATLNNQFNIVCNAVKTTDTGSSLVVTATQNTDNVRAKLFEPSLNSAFTLPDVAYDFFRGLAISAEAEATVEAEPLRIKQLGASLTGAFSPSIDAVAILRPDVFLEVEANVVEVEPVIFAGAQSFISSAFTVTVQAERTVDYVADLSVTATIPNANIFRIQQFEMSLASAFTTNVDYLRIRESNVTLDLNVTTQITPLILRSFEIQLNTAVSLQALPQLLVEAGADITAQFEDTFVVTRLRKAEADLSVFGFSVTVGDIINIDPFRQLIVPSETRFIKVSQETRRVIVPSETRILEV